MKKLAFIFLLATANVANAAVDSLNGLNGTVNIVGGQNTTVTKNGNNLVIDSANSITEGFESGLLYDWGVTGNAQITTEKARTGKKSLKITNGLAIAKKIPSASFVDMTLWVYVADLTEAYESFVVSFDGPGQGPSIWSRNTGYFHYADGTHETMNTGGFSFNTWFKIRIVQNKNSTTKYTYYVNDIARFTSNKIDVTTPIDRINIAGSDNHAGSVTLYVDDITIKYKK
jgi:hypothetical protein